uniref:Homeobox domain-containing protein n=1 Tax=Wuchereria bancrofti TaxID=6293 RepID=A0A1I8EAR3_WUCBA
MRTSFKHHQLRTMKNYFNLNHNPDAKDLEQLAQRTDLTKRTSNNSPYVLSLPSTSFNESIEPITCGSVDDSMEESWQTSGSPGKGSQRNEQSDSSNDDNKLNNGKTETEKSGCISSWEKSLPEYFETDQTML